MKNNGAGSNNIPPNNFQADKVLSYFKSEWRALLAVTISGLIYNIGLLANPWFEGEMTGCLVDILGKKKEFNSMLILVLGYIFTILAVQGCRYVKRFYVRRFSNNVNRRMKGILYSSLIHKSKQELEEEGCGNVLTKAILDVDDCAEGMRKFTTEIFDTGVALIAYAAMLLYYDFKLALLCMLFPPISYVLAEKMKTVVQKTGAFYKQQSAELSAATLDRASNAITYRVYGRECERNEAYETHLSNYENAAVRANIWSAAFPPIYLVISMGGVLFILYFGSKNVLGIGQKMWDVAAFTTFLSCFTKLSVKSSHAAKLFNAVHKAQVSWKRIKPLMKISNSNDTAHTYSAGNLEVSSLGFKYPGKDNIYANLSFTASPSQIIGVTGPVACGKSTFGKTFLCEYPYEGSIKFAEKELKQMDNSLLSSTVGYLGHDPELFDDSIKNNILMGDDLNLKTYLEAVCFYEEAMSMENGVDTIIGNSGVRLSGGQAQRLALARTLCHKKPLIILDDPFSALDRKTEEQVFKNIKDITKDSIVIILSHRLYLFPQMDQIIWMENGKAAVGTHEDILKTYPEYAKLYNAQIAIKENTDKTNTKGGESDAQQE